jgi:hypothetical protein
MVHALKEAWRVLRTGGVLVDLRPISVDVPLLIRTVAGWKSAGIPDQSPDRLHDVAADLALRLVVYDGLFIRVKRKYFEVNNYWNTLKDLKEDVDDRWKDDIILSKEIWQQARHLFKNGSGRRRVRFPFRKKIGVYQKI